MGRLVVPLIVPGNFGIFFPLQWSSDFYLIGDLFSKSRNSGHFSYIIFCILFRFFVLSCSSGRLVILKLSQCIAFETSSFCLYERMNKVFIIRSLCAEHCVKLWRHKKKSRTVCAVRELIVYEGDNTCEIFQIQVRYKVPWCLECSSKAEGNASSFMSFPLIQCQGLQWQELSFPGLQYLWLQFL